MKKAKLKPVVQGDGWPIAPSAAALDKLLPHKYAGYPTDPLLNRINDHTIYQTDDGQWHLWACVGNTPVHYVFCHWQANELTQSPWRFTGRIIRLDRNRGECQVVWKNADMMQSPFVVKENGLWYMVFGGYATGYDSDGHATLDYDSMENQICLMTSPDGYGWTRYDNGLEQSRIFVGPGAARDPCLIKINGLWHIYYCGHRNRHRADEGIYVRTSSDLRAWSEARLTHFIDHDILKRERTNGAKHHTNESPFVVERSGYFYLFRSGGYLGDGGGSASVFRSEDPLDFGVNIDPKEKYVCNINCHAPEIVVDREGREYISKIYDPERGHGIFLEHLTWEPS
jgi:hypothetical protein